MSGPAVGSSKAPHRTHHVIGGNMDIQTFINSPEIDRLLGEAFELVANTGDSFNVTETFSDGYYNHVTVVDVDEDGKSFAKTLKLSTLGAGCVSTGHAALHVLATLYLIVNEDDLVNDFDVTAYVNALADSLTDVRNKGLAGIAQ